MMGSCLDEMNMFVFNLADLLFELSSQGWFMQMSAMIVSITLLLIICLIRTWDKKIMGLVFLYISCYLLQSLVSCSSLYPVMVLKISFSRSSRFQNVTLDSYVL